RDEAVLEPDVHAPLARRTSAPRNEGVLSLPLKQLEAGLQRSLLRFEASRALQREEGVPDVAEPQQRLTLGNLGLLAARVGPARRAALLVESLEGVRGLLPGTGCEGALPFGELRIGAGATERQRDGHQPRR